MINSKTKRIDIPAIFINKYDNQYPIQKKKKKTLCLEKQ